MEVFISTCLEQSKQRRYLFSAVCEAWWPKASQTYWDYLPHGERFQWAERLSSDSVYCLTDDDCLPCPWLDLGKIAQLFRDHPDYATIACMNLLNPVKGEGLIEAEAVGGIRFIRKGVVTEFPADFDGDDSRYFDLVKAKGFKQGYVPEFPMLHLGCWHSTWKR